MHISAIHSKAPPTSHIIIYSGPFHIIIYSGMCTYKRTGSLSPLLFLYLTFIVISAILNAVE